MLKTDFMRGKSSYFLNILMLLAFISAGISPACKFISGQMTWMEICGAQGVKTVAVPGDDIPADSSSDHQLKERCGFCFTSAHLKSLAVLPVLVSAPVTVILPSQVTAQDKDFSSSSTPSFLARGPPVAV